MTSNLSPEVRERRRKEAVMTMFVSKVSEAFMMPPIRRDLFDLGQRYVLTEMSRVEYTAAVQKYARDQLERILATLPDKVNTMVDKLGELPVPLNIIDKEIVRAPRTERVRPGKTFSNLPGTDSVKP